MKFFRVGAGKVLAWGRRFVGIVVPSGTFIATEALDDITTESGDNLVTE